MPDADLPVQVKHIGGFAFIAADEEGHSIVVDVPKDPDGRSLGFAPTRLLLASLAACTGMDVVQVLGKRRIRFDSLVIHAGGEQASGYPAYFTKIRLKYEIRGKDVPDDEVNRAIQLSKDAYCSVGATLDGKAEIETSYEIIRE